MKLKSVSLTVLAAAAAVVVSACGGGGGGAAAPQASLQLSGVAATGLALANSEVSVKCASGNGTATTDGSGTYEVVVTDGALPCIIKVTGTADGVAVTLHSIAEAGTSSGSTTTATANVTPLTEMVVAQLSGGLPATLFDGFGAASSVTAEQLAAATTTLLTALSAATGVDLSAIDPFKGALVPATDTAAGNAYDDALEALKTKIPMDVLPLVVNQIASASAASTVSGSGTAPITLAEVLQSAAAGSLANCPSALSGKYRVIDFRGATQTVQLDFGRNKVIDGTTELDITPSTTQACEFSVADGNDTTVVFGPNGVGALRDNHTTGLIFPVQSLAYDAIQGEWRFVESGIEEDGNPTHFVGNVTFGADGSVGVCDYYDIATQTMSTTCTPDDAPPQTPKANADGGFTMMYGDGPVTFYGYRTPAGALTLFGSSNTDGASGPGILQTHFVAFKPQALPMPQLDAVRKTWDVVMIKPSTGSLLSAPLERPSQTITAVDSASGTYSRVVETRPDVTDIFSINQPLAGMVQRTNRSPVYAASVPGTGLSLAITGPGNANYLYVATVNRP